MPPRKVLPLAFLLLAVVAATLWTGGRPVSGQVSEASAIFTIDGANPYSLTDPVADDCPAAAPCKSMEKIGIGDDGAPMPFITTVIPPAFQGPDGTAVPNGRTTGSVHVIVHWSLGGPCSDSSPSIDASATLLDGAVRSEGSDDSSSQSLTDVDV